MKAYTNSQTREFDRKAIEEFGLPGSTLMARAAEAVFKFISDRYPQSKKLGILCGTGNNGGDGFVLARICQSLGYKPTVFLMGAPDEIEGDALVAYENLHGSSALIELGPLSKDLKEYDLLIDSLLGSGLNRLVEGDYLKTIQAINESGIPVVAVDIPSGLHGDTGIAMGAAVNATATLCFIGRKRGLYTADGPDHAGEIIFDDLKVPIEVYENADSVFLLESSDFKEFLKPRRKNAHKGIYGHSLLIAGNMGMMGAASLAAHSALRVGSGLVSLVTQQEYSNFIVSTCPEIMTLGAKGIQGLSEKLDQVTVVAIGPGLGQDDWAHQMWDFAFKSEKPLIVDADALNLLAQKPCLRKNWLLTPHPGEAARLLNCSSQEVQNDRFRAVRELQKKYQARVILKGCGTLVATDLGLSICPYGNPGMASGGMGDVLTGVLAGLMAQYQDLDRVAQWGVLLHALAGDRAAEMGERGLLASDLLNPLREIINSRL